MLVVGIVAAGVIALVFLRNRGPESTNEAQGEAHVDFKLEAANAGFNAPEGKTPCETGYNAIKAMDDWLSAAGRSKPWPDLPDRDTFVARCATLPEQEQLCLQPKYSAKNHKTCDAINDRVPSPLEKVLKPSGGASTRDASPE